MGSGFHTVRFAGRAIHASPYVRPHLTDEVVRSIVFELEERDLNGVTLTADYPRGPFTAQRGDWLRGRGATPLEAVANLMAKLDYPDLTAALEASLRDKGMS